jgi:predicted metal-dependent hydrolase
MSLINDNSLDSSCSTNFGSDLDPDFIEAIAQFNDGEYYACHDTLEEIWHNAWQSDRAFYQGILQIAVGLYHLYNQNWNGAVILLGEGTSRLPVYVPEYMSIDVETLLSDSLHLLKTLQQSGKAVLPEILNSIANGDLQPPKIARVD